MKKLATKIMIGALWVFAVIGFLGIVFYLIFKKKGEDVDDSALRILSNIQQYFAGVKTKADGLAAKANEEAVKAEKVKEDIMKVDSAVDKSTDDEVLNEVHDAENNNNGD